MFRSSTSTLARKAAVVILASYTLLACFSPSAQTYAQAEKYVGDCSGGPTDPADPSNPSAQWTHPAPGLWVYLDEDSDSIYEHYHMDGLAGYASSIALVWSHRILSVNARIQQILDDPQPELDPGGISSYIGLSQYRQWLEKEQQRAQSIVNDSVQGGGDPTAPCSYGASSGHYTANASTSFDIGYRDVHVIATGSTNSGLGVFIEFDVFFYGQTRNYAGDDEHPSYLRMDAHFRQSSANYGQTCGGSSYASARYGTAQDDIVTDTSGGWDKNCE